MCFFLAAARVSLLPVRHDPFAAPKVDNATAIAINKANSVEYFEANVRANASALIISRGDNSVKYDMFVSMYSIVTAGMDVLEIMVTNMVYFLIFDEK